MEFPKIMESSLSNIAGTAQIILNRRTGGQIMIRGRVILGCSSITDGSKLLEEHEQPQLHWTLQLPCKNNILVFVVIYGIILISLQVIKKSICCELILEI